MKRSVLISLVKDNFPKLHKVMKSTFMASTDEEFAARWKEYELEIEKYLYLKDFLAVNFSERPDLFQSLLAEKRIPAVVKTIGDRKNRRKYRVLFELMRKSQMFPTEKRVELLFHEKLPVVAASVFKKLKAKGKLIRS